MLKKRMILCLLVDNNGVFYNSRNFEIQPIGKLDWILRYLNFDAIDELVLLNVSREGKDVTAFCRHMRDLSRYCFVPISAGGGVRTVSDGRMLLENGADKVIINSANHTNPGLIAEAANVFGSQCIVASVDVRKNKLSGATHVVFDNGSTLGPSALKDWLQELEKRGVGEVFLTSCDADGVGKGYDIVLLRNVCSWVNVPVIASGGVGELHHLVEGIETGVSAVSAANLFHYVGDGLTRAKQYLAQEKAGFPTFIFSAAR